MRLIDADYLINNKGQIDDYANEYYTEQDIAECPTVEAAPVVHGQWDMFGCCNQCRYGDEKQDTQYIKENYKHCPHCGAKMDL